MKRRRKSSLVTEIGYSFPVDCASQGDGGDAAGGAILNIGTMTSVNNTIWNNQALAGRMGLGITNEWLYSCESPDAEDGRTLGQSIANSNVCNVATIYIRNT